MNAIANIFDPKHYRQVYKPLLEAETLPPWCYTSEEFYRREVDRIFRKTWNFVGRADEIPNPGDYMTLDICGEPIIVLRDKDGTLRAFANTCRHRGAKIVEGKGNCRGLSCPYHGWVYALNGDLIGTAGMEQTKAFDRSKYSLPALRVDSWAGFLFVNMGEGGPSLKQHLGDLPTELAPYRFEDYVTVGRQEWDLKCNWKIFLENAMEEYHTPIVHRKSIGAQSMTEIEGEGEWDALHMAAERTIAVLPEDKAHALPQNPHVTGRPASGTYFISIYPATFFACTQDVMWWLHQVPKGPGRCIVQHGAAFPRATVERPDFKEKLPYYLKRWNKSVPEDNWISEQQQAGLASSLSTPGRLSFHEPVVQYIGQWVLDRVMDKRKANGEARRAPARKAAKKAERR
ncbi:MAG: aromatic ring-hydroxylating dioxygenase subunit alpha [Alphaproteobacteria bacterium]|nr:aromatic ring-hydroxylating dioxygenase subunit alpha [Alphaproteobacteria bacterium]